MRSSAPDMAVAATAAGRDFWSALPPADQEELAAAGRVKRFARGRNLMHQGQAPAEVHLVRAGQVKVYSTTTTGREVVLAIRGAGELLGELAALDAQPRSASVAALVDTDALVLTPGAFRAFLATHPAAALALLGMLTRRLRDADTKRAGFTTHTALGRVAARVIELADRFGTDDGDGRVRIDLRLSQEELAGWTGASLESVGRALATMRSLHWIETRRREIHVLDLDALRRAAA
jgi:CRP/FNR family transcriptional regulator, cyclic AMP receptor protein